MPEIKHTLTAGRMSKDVDERLVAKDEYRDANNIEITTSEGSNAGVVQTLLGNTRRSDMANFNNVTGVYDLPDNDSGTCVGSIANPAENSIYYFVHRELNLTTGVKLDKCADYILKYDTVHQTNKYVFVDIFRIATTVHTTVSDSTTFHIVLGNGVTTNQTGIRVGMRLNHDSYDDGDNVVVTDVSYDTDNTRWKITVDQEIDLTAADNVEFVADRVLKFSKNNIITGINILDDFLFWTDNVSEPKKINIKRSLLGTGGTSYLNNAGNGGVNSNPTQADTSTFNGENAYFHTRVVIEDNGKLVVKANIHADGNSVSYVKECDITVIKESPNTPLNFDMFTTSIDRVNPNTNLQNLTTTVGTASFVDDTLEDTYQLLQPGDQTIFVPNEPVDLRPDDIVLLSAGTQTTYSDSYNINTENIDVRARVVAGAVVGPDGVSNLAAILMLEVLSINEDLNSTVFRITLEDKDDLFQYKFPRFSYRYKYQDGEYSTFAPFSEIAFLPSDYDYQPKKGHNLGMVNNLKSLRLKGYHPSKDNIPNEVVEIDILYKETNNPTVYKVKTITPQDGHPLWPDFNVDNSARGEFDLETDLIHSVLPANQILRAYDNVPRQALAQEINANRLIYGNYLQNYDVGTKPIINLSFTTDTVDLNENYDYAPPSVKSIRDYQVGVVFGDRYGRETPVLSSKKSSIRIPKKQAEFKNRLKVSTDGNVPSWAEYMSYYVKETSVEYYSLSMDRWYEAEDGNVWLSFPSSERNKLDEETFLILKKAHGSNIIVKEKARYKILAISSEAPDFIKTRRISLGKVFNDDNAIGSNGFGFPLPEMKKISIQSNEFRQAFGDQLHIETPKRLFLRVTQGGLQGSQYYRVANIAHSTQANGEPSDFYVLNMRKPFGEDMAFTSTGGTASSAVDGLAVELLEERVENRPEFDGRFFVKIFRDSTLTKYVANVAQRDWFVKNAFPIGYINNNGYVNAGTRNMHKAGMATAAAYNASPTPPGFDGKVPVDARYPLAPRLPGSENQSTWPNLSSWQQANPQDVNAFTGEGGVVGSGTNSSSDYFRHYTTWHYPHSTMHPTEHDWSGLTGYDASSYTLGKAYKWRNEDSSFDNMFDRMTECNIQAINGPLAGDYTTAGYDNELPTSGFFKSARKFWRNILQRKRFFIDAATAYSWTGLMQDKPGNRYPSNSFNNLQWVSIAAQTTGGFPIANGNGFHIIPMTGSDAISGGDNYGDPNAPAGTSSEDMEYAYFSSYRVDFGGPHNFWASGANPATYIPYLPIEESAGSMAWEPNDNYADAQGWPSYETPNPDDGYEQWCRDGVRGTPSRGIWTTDTGYCAMDISWNSWDDSQHEWSVHVPRAEWPNGTTASTVPEAFEKSIAMTLANHPEDAINDAARDFIEDLVTPGSYFRFANDPDQTVYSVLPYTSPYVNDGYDNDAYYKSTAGIENGAWGIRNIRTGSDTLSPAYQPINNATQYAPYNLRQRWTILVEPHIGSGPSGYNPIHGTDPALVTSVTADNFRRALKHDGSGDGDAIEILTAFSAEGDVYSDNPAIWETEPKEAAEVDIYYQASRIIPLNINKRTVEEYIPIGSCFYTSGSYAIPGGGGYQGGSKKHTITKVEPVFSNQSSPSHATKVKLTFTPGLPYAEIDMNNLPVPGVFTITAEDPIKIELPNNGYVCTVSGQSRPGGVTTLMVRTSDIESSLSNIAAQELELGWNNCWSFGNGAESDRIRDDFNAPQMDNGVKASATLGNQRVKEEYKKYGMIWSGIYNSNSGINNTNQFIAGESITKDINPTHGSIQALSLGDTLLRIFCEDKVLKAQSNKDILFNADGNQQVVASNKVVGAVTAYAGDFGISTNPESLVTTPFLHYFTDVNRGKVLVRSGEGIRPISEIGMKDYFADTMAQNVVKAIGSYDERKNEYNVSITKAFSEDQSLPTEQITVSYNEGAKGWSSFKSFYTTVSSEPARVKGMESGLSLNNNYYTFHQGHLYQHHINETRNNFYGTQYTSDVTMLFNDMSEAVKSFNTINYEGSQARITNFDEVDGVNFYNNDSTTGSGATVGTTTVNDVTDGEYYNLGTTISGWYVDNIDTNLQTCGQLEFKDKEGKWFAFPTGDATSLSNLDEKEFSVQGLGVATMTHSGPGEGGPIVVTVNNRSTSSSGASWD